MKIKLFTLLLCISICASGQFKYTYNPEGFNSYFQKLEKGIYKGYTNGIMQFEFKDGTKLLSSFSKDSAILEIVPDPHKIYDVSYKNYEVRNKEILIKYCTYFKANAISITIADKIYIFSLFDGASIGDIDGIDYEYISNKDRELLILHFTDNVALYTTKSFTSMRVYSLTDTTPGLYIMKGSTLIFSINI